MKIAVPTRQGYIDDHLECCESYTIYTVNEDMEITAKDVIYPFEVGCCMANPAIRLRQCGVTQVLAGSVEDSVYDRMTGFGLEILREFHGMADQVVNKYLGKMLANSNKSFSVLK